MAKVKRISAVRLHDRAYEEIKKGLLTGAFPPGEVMTVGPLADQLGTSPQPAREALTRLVGEGILQQLPNRSVRVPLLTREEFDEITEVRVLLEGASAARAAKNATPVLIRELEKLMVKMDGAIARKSGQYYTYNYKFHFQVYAAGNSAVMLSMVEKLWFRSVAIFGRITEISTILEQRLSEGQFHHHELVDALRAGSSVDAERAVRDDILAAAKWGHQSYSFAQDGPKDS